MSERLKKKIEGIKDQYDNDSQAEFDRMLKGLDDVAAIKELGSHFAIKDFTGRLAKQIELINQQLQEKKSSDLSDRDRDNLIDRKRLFQSFINIFVQADKEESRITKAIEDLN